MGIKNLGFRFFLQKNLKYLKGPNFRFLGVLKKNRNTSRFYTHIHSRKLLPFSLISCVYSYAIVCT